MTAEEFAHIGSERYHFELVDGSLVVRDPCGTLHAFVTGRLHHLLALHLTDRADALVLTGEPGFVLARMPDTVRAPDVAVVIDPNAARLASAASFHEGPPTLAIEVASPSKPFRALADKARAWLAAGCRLVWVIDPERRTASVLSSAPGEETIDEQGSLAGGEVLPGFQCRLREVLPRLQ